MPLVTAVSYIFQVFFTLISLILLFATFHALLVLPVVLSLIGPDAHPEDLRAKLDALYEGKIDGDEHDDDDDDDGAASGAQNGGPKVAVATV